MIIEECFKVLVEGICNKLDMVSIVMLCDTNRVHLFLSTRTITP